MELRYIKWGKFIKDSLSPECLKRIPYIWSLQWYLSGVVRKQGMMVINIDKLDKNLYFDYSGIKFIPDLIGYSTIFYSWKEYPIDKIKLTDVVLDLGACIGGFSLPASKVASKVYALEPLGPLADLLDRNSKLNNITNIQILRYALGPEGERSLDYEGIKGDCKFITFSSLMSQIPDKIDIVKMDCEGGEWSVDLDLLGRPRLLFGELHYKMGGGGRWDKFKNWFDSNGYDYTHRYSGRGVLGYFNAERR